MGRRTAIIGNWKMNGVSADCEQLRGLSASPAAARSDVDIAICPPFTLLRDAAEALGDGPVGFGAQDCSAHGAGAHTGDVAAAMIAEFGARYVIVGHSERRADHGETDALVAAKAAAAHAAGLIAVICLGETEAERDAGRAETVVAGQLAGSLPQSANAAGVIIAYEPVWAIGTGRTPSADDIVDMHAALRARAQSAGLDAEALRILYGGSVKPGNAEAILALQGVDGALVGGASLKAEDFAAIIAAAPTA